MLSLTTDDNGILRLKATGKLTDEEIKRVVPQIEEIMSLDDKIRILIELEDFDGWTLKGLWQDLKFDVAHHDDMDRVAIVGDRRWQEWGTRLSSPFFKAEMRYFDRDQKPEAETWLTSH